MRRAWMVMVGSLAVGACGGEPVYLNGVDASTRPVTRDAHVVADVRVARDVGVPPVADSGCDERDAGNGVVTLSPSIGVWSLAVDDEYVYATSFSPDNSGVVYRMAKCGGSVVTLATTGPNLNTLAVDDTSVYWVGTSADGGPDGVRMASKEGGPASTVYETQDALIVDEAPDDTNVYLLLAWTSEIDPPGAVLRVPKTGGAAVTLASGPNTPASLALDEDNVYWQASSDSGDSPGALMYVPKAGGTATTLVSAAEAPMQVAVFGSDVYWVDFGFSIWSIPKSGGTPFEVLASSHHIAADFQWGLAVDSTNVYFGDGTSTYSVPAGGGTATRISNGTAFSNSGNVTIDDTSVYWIYNYAIQKAPK